jgi:hypothetical protein
MKKKLLLLFIGLTITTQMIYSQVPSYVPTNGLVGYWPFNGNANDQTPSGYNGTVNGATLTTDRFGNSNSAYNFDGVNDYIEVQNSQNLNSQTWTISTWINANGYYFGNVFGNISYGNMIVGKGTDFNSGFYGLSYSSQSLKVGSYYGVGSQANGTESTTNITLNNWINVIGTWDGVNMKIYVNGQLENSNSNFSNNPGINNENLFFGTMAQNNLYPYWLNGKIDDIGIWNRALTQQEITNMYTGVNYSDTCNAVSGSLTNGLVGYWPFCGNANDDSGNGNNGVVNGATLVTDRFGNSNSAYSFNGSNKISVPNLQSYLFNSKITISAWVNLSSIPNSNFNLVTKYGGAGFDDAFSLDVSSTNYQLNISPGSTSWTTCVGNSSIQTNQWHNLVGVYDYSNNIFKIYLDGVLLGSNTALSAMGNALSAKVIFGYYDDPLLVSPNQQFNGKLDDIGIWNRALSPQEITQLYNQNQCITNITVTDTLIINVGQLSYTNPVTYANNITIYPNPANTQVNISFNNISDLTGGHINIINSLGQQVTTTPITLSGTNTTLPLNTWGGTGLYFVQIVNVQGQIVDIKKIILQ